MAPVVVVIMLVMARVGQRGPSTDMNVVIVSFDDHNIVCVFGVVMVIVVMIVVVMVVVAVAWIRGAAVESEVAIRPIDVDARTRIAFFLCQWLYCRRRKAMRTRMMRVDAQRQKRR